MVERDEHETVVVFRRWRSGSKDVIALFPGVEWYGGTVASYMHVGQHSGADYLRVVGFTRPAREDEPDVRALMAELEGKGYRLKVRRRWARR